MGSFFCLLSLPDRNLETSMRFHFHFHAVEVGIGPHVDHDVQVADFNETRLPSQKYYDQYTGLELDLTIRN